MAGSVRIEGLDKLQAKIQRVSDFGKWASKPMREAQKVVQKEARRYPRKSGTFTTKATPGQKRAYWAKVRSGEAQHGPRGYVRSNRLKQGWTIQAPQVSSSGVMGEVTNDVGYGVYVMGRYRQSFHADSPFLREEEVAEKVSAEVGQIFESAMGDVLRT